MLASEPMSFPPTVQKVKEFLEFKGSTREVQRLPDSTATSQQAAEALNVKVSQIAKSVVFGLEDKTVVAVLPGDKRVDLKKLAAAISVEKLKRLDPDQVKLRTGFVIGGVCPFGLPSNVSLVIDQSLKENGFLYAAAGDSHAVVGITFDELIEITGGKIESVVE